MPELSVEISAQLDAEALVGTLVSELSGLLAELGIVELPIDPARIQGIVGDVSSLDTSSLEVTLADLARLAEEVVGELPLPDQLLGPIQALLDLLGELDTTDLGAQFEGLRARLAAQLDSRGDGSFLDVLERIAEALSSAPEGQLLLGLLRTLVTAAGGRLPEGSLSLSNALPGLLGSLRLIGALMALESALAEAERLTVLMADQIDPQAVSRAEARLTACLGSGSNSLAAAIGRLDADDELEVAAIKRAVVNCGREVDGLRLSLVEAMGFGEATLAYLDPERLRAEIEVAAAQVLAVDLDPVERAAGTLAERIAGLVSLDVDRLPSFTLEALLDEVESKIGELAASIESIDVDQVAAPITGLLEPVTTALGELVAHVATIRDGLVEALAKVRDAVAALPLDTIADAVGGALEPVNEVLTRVSDVIGEAEGALSAAAAEIDGVLVRIEGTLDGFKGEIDGLFGGARDVVAAVDLEAVVGTVAEGIDQFSQLIDQARLKPALDTAEDAIESAADVLDAVPFALIPESMKAEVDAAVKPVKDVDATAVETSVRSTLDLVDGRFQFQADLEAAVADLQSRYDALIATIGEHDPRRYLASIDSELAQLSGRLAELVPDLTLEPVEQALAQMRELASSLDLATLLQPVEEAFDTILEGLDQVSPAALIAPVAEQVTRVREDLLDQVKLREWGPSLDKLADPIRRLAERADTTGLEGRIEAAVVEARQLLDSFPESRITAPIGNFFASMLGGSGLRVYPWSFDAVLGWLVGESGSSALEGRLGRVADAVDRALASVTSLDPATIAARHQSSTAEVRAAVSALPAGSRGRLELEVAVAGLDLSLSLSAIGPNRGRLEERLRAASGMAVSLRGVGLSEVDSATGRLRTALAPLRSFGEAVSAAAERVGLPGIEDGPAAAFDRLLEAAPPERLGSMFMPLFTALASRLELLLTAVIAPLQGVIADLVTAAELVDLAPVQAELEAIHAAARDEIDSLRPTRMLAPSLAAVGELQARLAGFDPFGALREILDALTVRLDGVSGKLESQILLEVPLGLYDDILVQLSVLDVGRLMAPLFLRLEEIAAELDGGLTGTFDAFEALQEALPSGGGGLSVSVSVDLGIG